MKLKLRVTDIKGTLYNKKKTLKRKSRRCFENQPNEIWSHLSEKVSIGWCFGADKLQNHINEAKGKEKKKERGGRKEEKREKQWLLVAPLVFFNAKGPFEGNVFKNLARNT